MEKGILADGFINSCLDIMNYRDKYTRQHCILVGYFSGLLANVLDLPIEVQEEMQLSGKAHDLGKISWDDTLHKCVKKNELENYHLDLIYAHPKIGADFLYNAISGSFKTNPEENINQRWIGVILCHHWGYKEEYKAYPPLNDPSYMNFLENLAECSSDDKFFNLMIGIVKIADSFHAAISERLYREISTPKSIDTAWAEIAKENGTIYHPEVASALEKSLPHFKELFNSDRLNGRDCPKVGCGILSPVNEKNEKRWECDKCGIIIKDNDHWWKMMETCQRSTTSRALNRFLGET
jgi:ribosomal protein S27AE